MPCRILKLPGVLICPPPLSSPPSSRLFLTGSTLSLAEERGSCTLTVPLPSVGTKVFAASPHSTVQRFTESIAREDTSIKSVEVFDYEGDSIAGSMSVTSTFFVHCSLISQLYTHPIRVVFYLVSILIGC